MLISIVMTLKSLSQSPGFALPLKKWQDIPFSDRSLYITNDRSIWIVNKFDSHLGHITSITSSTKDFVNFSQLDGLILFFSGRGTKVMSGITRNIDIKLCEYKMNKWERKEYESIERDRHWWVFYKETKTKHLHKTTKTLKKNGNKGVNDKNSQKRVQAIMKLEGRANFG